ncbi:hypothetical protein N0V88_000973 [Collariella sp. IMI 366227]|nr:hypothetical protein N0V88_000973 [Collariella sp. IMI 366227]
MANASFTPSPSDLLPPSSANKDKGGGFWGQDPADFFDQYVELGESDGELSSVGSEAVLMSFEQSFFTDRNGTAQVEHLLVSDMNMITSGTTTAGSNLQNARQRQQLRPTTSNMTAGFNNMNIEGLPCGRSISDSELLRLEGLTMRSPRIQIPQLSASEPVSPPGEVFSPRKAGRLERFYGKIRNKAVAIQGKANQSEQRVKVEEPSLSVMSTATLEPERTAARLRPQTLSISKSQLPSPPLTSGMPDQTWSVTSSDAAFVNGFLQESFISDSLLGSQFVPPLQLNGNAMPQTPLQTPSLEAMWQMPASAPSTKTLWTTPNTYFTESISTDTNWWDSTDAMDTDPFLPSFYTAAAQNARNASLNLAIQLQQPSVASFEYPAPPGTEDPLATSFGNTTSSLVLHMPQPRAGMPSAVLHDTTHRSARADYHHRRPKPRAPSSGARQHTYGLGVSPRKARAGIGSAKRSPSLNRIGGSVSPSSEISASSLAVLDPSPRLHRRSVSMQPLTQPEPHRPAYGQQLVKRGFKGTIPKSSGNGFVNYTPQDRTLLMTGVAPSGSSKTKARREREAAERQRGPPTVPIPEHKTFDE